MIILTVEYNNTKLVEKDPINFIEVKMNEENFDLQFNKILMLSDSNFKVLADASQNLIDRLKEVNAKFLILTCKKEFLDEEYVTGIIKNSSPESIIELINVIIRHYPALVKYNSKYNFIIGKDINDTPIEDLYLNDNNYFQLYEDKESGLYFMDIKLNNMTTDRNFNYNQLLKLYRNLSSWYVTTNPDKTNNIENESISPIDYLNETFSSKSIFSLIKKLYSYIKTYERTFLSKDEFQKAV